MLLSPALDMSSKKESLLDDGLDFLDHSQADLQAQNIKPAEIDAMVSKYGNDKAMQKKIDSWKTTIKHTNDPQGGVLKLLAVGQLALARLQTSSNWKAQVRLNLTETMGFVTLAEYC